MINEQSETLQPLSENTSLTTFYAWAMKSTSKQLADGHPVEMSGLAQLVETVTELLKFYPNCKFNISVDPITQPDFTMLCRDGCPGCSVCQN